MLLNTCDLLVINLGVSIGSPMSRIHQVHFGIGTSLLQVCKYLVIWPEQGCCIASWFDVLLMVGSFVADWLTGLFVLESFVVRAFHLPDVLVILNDLVWSISLWVLYRLYGFREGSWRQINVVILGLFLDRLLASWVLGLISEQFLVVVLLEWVSHGHADRLDTLLVWDGEREVEVS